MSIRILGVLVVLLASEAIASTHKITVPHEGSLVELHAEFYSQPYVLANSQPSESLKFKSEDSFRKVQFFWNHSFPELKSVVSPEALAGQEQWEQGYNEAIEAFRLHPERKAGNATVIAIVSAKVGTETIEYVIFSPSKLTSFADLENQETAFVSSLLFRMRPNGVWEVLPISRFPFLSDLPVSEIADLRSVFANGWAYDSGKRAYIAPSSASGGAGPISEKAE